MKALYKIIRIFSLMILIVIILGYLTIEYKIYDKNKNGIDIIAHAGGEIHGNTYTNSLEALNKSYSDGARIFELDISQTKDGAYVAVHDWDGWKKMTSYTGDLPPILSDFKKYKIHDKYSGLDFEDINKWFSTHEDAILVTDKINVPSDIVNLFVDKKRLRMELFSKEAIIDASHIFDGGMASFYILTDTNDNYFNKIALVSAMYFIKENKIEYIVSSAPISYKEKFHLKLLRAFGVNVYMYLSGSNEEIKSKVTTYRNYIDGVYYNEIPQDSNSLK